MAGLRELVAGRLGNAGLIESIGLRIRAAFFLIGRYIFRLVLFIFFLVLSVEGLLFFLFLFLLLQLLFTLGIFGSLDILEVLHADGFNLVILKLLDKLFFLRKLHLDHDVFGFEIRVYDLAAFVQVDKSQQYISGYLLDQPQRHAFFLVFVMLDHVEQVGPHEFEHTAHMLSMYAVMCEIIQQK